jgi:hypothetical protein
LEDRLRQLEAHTVDLQVGGGFGMVPLKFHFHDTTEYQYMLGDEVFQSNVTWS